MDGRADGVLDGDDLGGIDGDGDVLVDYCCCCCCCVGCVDVVRLVHPVAGIRCGDKSRRDGA